MRAPGCDMVPDRRCCRNWEISSIRAVLLGAISFKGGINRLLIKIDLQI